MNRGQLVLVSIAAGFGSAIFAAIIVALVDLYVVGHGGVSLGRTWISQGAAVSLSRADAIVLVAAAATMLGTFSLGRRK